MIDSILVRILDASRWSIAMRIQVSVEADELEDELELHNAELRKQIADGYQAYLCSETKDLNRLIAELRQLTWPAMSRAEG